MSTKQSTTNIPETQNESSLNGTNSTSATNNVNNINTTNNQSSNNNNNNNNNNEQKNVKSESETLVLNKFSLYETKTVMNIYLE